MSGLTLEYSHDVDAITRGMNAVSKIDFDPAHDAVGAHMIDRVKERMHDQFNVDGDPLIQSEAARMRDGLTLIDTGNLRDSYTHNLLTNGVEVGSDLDYAAIHHFGGKTGRNNATTIQANPVLGLDAHDEEVIGEIYLDHVRDTLKREVNR